MNPYSNDRSAPGWRRALRVGLSSLVIGWSVLAASAAQVILYQERFETEGEGTRWVTEGRGELDPQPPPAGFPGPSFWELNFNVSFVGVRANAPERRAGMVWHHLLPRAGVSPQFLQLFDSLVDWMTSNRVSRTVLFHPAIAGEGDQVLVDRLMSRGFTVVTDDGSAPAPDPATVALVIHSSNGAGPDPTRWTIYTAPLLSYNAANHDDELISSIGATTTFDPGLVTIAATNHPAAGGQSGTITPVPGSYAYDTVGATLPSGGTTIATYNLVAPRNAVTLADVDAMVAGTFASIKSTGTLAVADMSIGEVGRFTGGASNDAVPPGNPDTARTFGTRATGKLRLVNAGTYTLAIMVDDGARLRIDRNRNGIDAGDNVFNEEDGAGLRVRGVNVTFAAAGEYDFEWVTLATGANFGQEIGVPLMPGADLQVEPWDDFLFQVLGSPATQSDIQLVGEISIVTYLADDVVREPRAFLIVVDRGASLLGGPITGFEGSGFWAGADLNEPSYGSPFQSDVTPKSLTLPPVNVTGKTNVTLRVLVAGSDVDFEDPDFLRISADPDGDGPEPAYLLANFRQFAAGTPNRGALGDLLDGQKTVLRGLFKEVSYPISNATTLVIRFEAMCTFFNEVMAFDNVRIMVEGADPPTIRIAGTGAGAVITYTGILQSSDTVNGTYTDVTGASSPYPVPPGGPGAKRFYQSRNP